MNTKNIIDKEKIELAEIACKIFNDHLDFITELNETNPRLASILLMDLSFHLKNLKNLSNLKDDFL